MLRVTLSRLQTPLLHPRLVPKTLKISPFSFLSSSAFSSRRHKGSSDADEDAGRPYSFIDGETEGPPRLFVVQPRLRPEPLLQSKLSEALNLANSLEDQRDGFYGEDFASKKAPPFLVVQNPSARSLRADMYFGPGTVENIKCQIKALEGKDQVDAVFVNTILSGIQQRNLEMTWKKPVLDRVGLIIEIFNAHAETKEAKLQAELAALMYKKSRLVRVRGPGGRLTFGASGEAEVVSARGRGSGGRGFISGAGETELQLQRRRIHERRKYLLSQIEEVRRTRAVQRAARKRHGGSNGEGLATVAVVGYTNAGKSTLVSALTETDLYSDDRLFATVDPRLRSVILPSGRKALLSDTVGFISDLPVQLVEAFHATLEEVVEADLLVHVLDSSAPNLDEQRTTVLEVLQQIGVSEEKIQNMIEVWNKIDLMDKDIGIGDTLEEGEWLSGAEEYGNISEDECLTESEVGGAESTVSADECPSGCKEKGDETTTLENECLSGGVEEMDETLSGDELFSGGEEETIAAMEDRFTSDQEEHNMVSDLSSEESLETGDDREPVSLKQQRIAALKLPPNAKFEIVKTSAVMGIGLQELLEVIDKKLSEKKSVVTKSLGPFDRKWRPSSTSDAGKVAQQ